MNLPFQVDGKGMKIICLSLPGRTCFEIAAAKKERLGSCTSITLAHGFYIDHVFFVTCIGKQDIDPPFASLMC
jgi:hypothetical protein